MLTHASNLVQLDATHPGFRDAAYRARRDELAGIALAYRGGPVPAVEYSSDEQQVWREVRQRLAPLHERWACRELQLAGDRLALDAKRIPQLADVNSRLSRETGFLMAPVAGLVTPRAFLERLGESVFLATQYVRHPAAPLYTPEPDVVHELIGHAASLTCPELARVNRALGQAALCADAARLRAIERVYWFTLEFGVVAERGEVRALGAGLLSSAGELERLGGAARLLPWDLSRMAESEYDPTAYQPALFVAPSFQQFVIDLESWARDGSSEG